MDRTPQVSRWEIAAGVLCLAVLAATCIACPPPSLKTPEARAAYTAGEVLQRVEELKAAAVEAHRTIGPDGQPLLAKEPTRYVLLFVLSAETALRDSPHGWRPAVANSYAGLRGQLSPAEKEKIAIPLAALDLAVGLAVTGGTR